MIKKTILSVIAATALTAVSVNAALDLDCPGEHDLVVAIGKQSQTDLENGKSFTVTSQGKTWTAENIHLRHDRVNLATGAKAEFSHNAGVCHVSFNKKVDTPEGVSVILTLDLH